MRLDDEHGRLNLILRSVREDLIDNGELTPLADEFGRARRISSEIEPGISVHGRVEDSCTTADDGFVVSEARSPGEAEPRRDVGLVGEDEIVSEPVVSDKGQIRR